MALVDLMDESFVVADRARLAETVRDGVDGKDWFPGLRLDVHQDRAEQGVRWTVTGELVGTAEVWLEPVRDGAVVHFFLRAEPTRRGSLVDPDTSPRGRRRARREARSRLLAWKRVVAQLKDSLEQGRETGMPRLPADAPQVARDRPAAPG